MDQIKEKKQIPKLLLSMSYPLVFAMLFQSSYAIVDTIFVGKGIGLKAIGGISLAMPISMIIQAVFLAVGVGSVVYTARLRGQKDFETVKKVANNLIIFSVVISIILTIFFQIFSKSIISSFSDDVILTKYGVTFLKTSSWFILPTAIQFTWTRLFLAEGNSK